MTTAIVPGSIAAVAQREGASIAEMFGDAEAIVIADTSGSMGSRDSRDGQSRYDVLKQELAKLQAEMPGKIAVCTFSDRAEWTPGGQPPYLGEGTDLAGALRFAKIADINGRRFIVISDGQPNDAEAALAVAATYQAPISAVYVGPTDGWQASGKTFLERLAAASGGKSATADRVMELAEAVRPMLTDGGQAWQ